MHRAVVLLVTLVLLCLPVVTVAQDLAVTVGGKPFQRKVVKDGNRVWIELDGLARALHLYKEQILGGWYVYRGASKQSSRDLVSSADKVVFGDRTIDNVTQDNRRLVDLTQALDALGLKVTAEGNAIAIPLPEAPASAAGSASQYAVPLPPLYLGKENPGAVIDVDSVTIPGKFNFFYWYTPGHAKCKEIEPDLRKFLERMKNEPEARIVLVDVGYENSPLAQKYGASSLPTMVVLSRKGVKIACNLGHSTREILNDPNVLKEMRRREDDGLYVK